MNSQNSLFSFKALGDLLVAGLIGERFAVGTLAVFAPHLVRAGIGSLDLDTGTGRAFMRGFGLRHASLGALLLFASLQKRPRENQSSENGKALTTALLVNSVVELGDAFIVGKMSQEFPREQRASLHVAWGGLIGGVACLLAALVSERENGLGSPRLFASRFQA